MGLQLIVFRLSRWFVYMIFGQHVIEFVFVVKLTAICTIYKQTRPLENTEVAIFFAWKWWKISYSKNWTVFLCWSYRQVKMVLNYKLDSFLAIYICPRPKSIQVCVRFLWIWKQMSAKRRTDHEIWDQSTLRNTHYVIFLYSYSFFDSLLEKSHYQASAMCPLLIKYHEYIFPELLFKCCLFRMPKSY